MSTTKIKRELQLRYKRQQSYEAKLMVVKQSQSKMQVTSPTSSSPHHEIELSPTKPVPIKSRPPNRATPEQIVRLPTTSKGYRSADMKHNKTSLLAAVTVDSYALMMASKELKDDKEIVLAAVANNGRSLEYASDRLQNDVQIIQVAIRGGRLDLASAVQKAHPSLVKTAVSKDGCALKHADNELRDARDIVKVAVSQNGDALKYATRRLRDDKEIVLAAISNESHAFEYASSRLQNDQDVVMAVVKEDGKERTCVQDDELFVVDENTQRALAPKPKTQWGWEKFQEHLSHVKESIHAPDPVYDGTSSCCMSPEDPVRMVAIKIVHHWAFDNFILTLILINCMFMIVGSPYAPCCRTGQTLAEGGSFVSSWSEPQQGCASDGTTLSTTAKSFHSLDTRNQTDCNTAAGLSSTTAALGQGKCSAAGYAMWRNEKDKHAKYPYHPANFNVDHYWPWRTTTMKCCVPVEWATTHGIYTEQKPETYPTNGPSELVLQPQLCADTDVLDAKNIADVIFTVCFTLEMIVKIIAMGFIMTKPKPLYHMPGSYLRDPWNWLDFIVVIAAYIELSGVGPGVAVLRTFRVLRPLRALNKAPSMKLLVRSLLRSFAPMVYVLLLVVFVLLLWGIVGTQLWSGLLHGSCYYFDANSNEYVLDPAQEGVYCGLDYIPVEHPSYFDRVAVGADPLVELSGEQYDVISTLFYTSLDSNTMIDGAAWSNFLDNSTTVARVNSAKTFARVCDDRMYGSQTWSTKNLTNISLVNGLTKGIPSMMCRYGENPNYDLSSFDNLGNAILWIFASITLEGWVDSMYNVNQVWSYQSPFMAFFVEGIYFTLLYLIGSMFMLNLTLAVIWEEFENERIRQDADDCALIDQELVYLGMRGIQVQNREEAEMIIRKRKREERQKSELTGDPVPEPWGPPCVRNHWYKLAISTYFGMFITIAILINTVTMALEYHNWTLYRATYNYNKTLDSQNKMLGEAMSQPAALTTFLEVTNYIFTVIFTGEMIIKMVGLSPRGYWKDSFNKFDFTIVMFSLLDIITTSLGLAGISGLSVLRTFRLLRVLRLAKSWESLQQLLITIMASLLDVSVAAALAALMMFIFTLLGMEIFGGQWNVETFGSADAVPRANFDSFGDGFMTVFQVLTGENWNDLLWASYHSNGVVGWSYFLALTFIGNYMIFNLFLAILLAKFEEGNIEHDQDVLDLTVEAAALEQQRQKGRTSPVTLKSKIEMRSSFQEDTLMHVRGKHIINVNVSHASEVTPKKNPTGTREKGGEQKHEEDEDLDNIMHGVPDDTPVLFGKSLFCLPPSHSFRKLAFALATNKSFDNLILILIIISSIFLAMDEPWVSTCACYNASNEETFSESCTSTTPLSWVGYFDQGNSMNYYQFLLYSDLVISFIFTIEMVTKIIALGFAFHEHSYLRNPWNVLDCLIVIISIVATFTGPLVMGICGTLGGSGELKALRALRIGRALRPLRVIKRDPGLRLVVNSLFQAAESIGTVMLVTLLFMMILGILGQQFFVGSVAGCNDENALTFPDCVGWFNISGTQCELLPHHRLQTTFTTEEWGSFAFSKQTPEFALDSIQQCHLNGETGSYFPRVWESNAVNFDTFGNSLTTVFEVASGEMWPDIMVTTIDARGIGQQPLPRSHPHFTFAWYFMVQFMIAFVMLNVFIGVIIEKYNENKAASEGSGLLTDDQKIWVETMKMALNSKAKKKLTPPKTGLSFRKPFYDLVIQPQFDYFIMLCILLNVMFMGSSHFDQPVVMHDILLGAMWTFNIIFTLEMLIKWVAIDKQYFYDPWNIFDFFLVILTWVAQTGALPPSLASLFRIFRVARMVRLVRNVTGLLNLFKTLIFSFPALKNVAIIMTLFMFIFSCFAMNTFGNIKPGELLTTDANFGTFFLSFNTMWRLSSGESYNGLMHDLNIHPPYCNPRQGGTINPNDGNCGNEFFSFFIMVMSFTTLNYILVNLFIAIILDNFSEQCSMSESKVTPEILSDFDDEWAKIDTVGSGQMLAEKLPALLDEIDYPLGLKNIPLENLHHKSLRKFRNQMIQKLQINSIDGYITFVQTKKALASLAMDGTQNFEEKIKAAGGSLVMKKLDRKSKQVQEQVQNKIVREMSNDTKMKVLIRYDEYGNNVGYYTIAHVQSVKTIQASVRGRIQLRKWTELIAEAREQQVMRDIEKAMLIRNNGDGAGDESHLLGSEEEEDDNF